MISLIVYAVRCIILILGIWFVTIVIGKKSLSQFTAYDAGILMIISNVVSQPLVNKDAFKTTFGIILLSLSIIIIGKLSLNKKFYRVDFTPSVLIANGVINRDALKKNHLSIYSLFSLLRQQGYSKISDVNFAILEMGGNISVIPKNSARNVSIQDMSLAQPEQGMTFPVIMDGIVFHDMLKYAKVTEQWLKTELMLTYKVEIKDVFYAEVDDNKKLFINLYEQSNKNEFDM